MSYTPKTEDQLIREGLLADGTYDFQVADTDDKPSKSGSDMFTLKLHVFDSDGNPRIVTDYIALGSNFGERKLRHAADACNIIDVYNSGALVHTDFMDKTGKVQIKTQEGTPQYPDPKNTVAGYMKRDATTATTSKPATAADLDDEIPF